MINSSWGNKPRWVLFLVLILWGTCCGAQAPISADAAAWLNQAREAKRENRLTEAYQSFEQAVALDSRVLFLADDGIGIDCIRYLREFAGKNPLSEDLHSRLTNLENLMRSCRVSALNQRRQQLTAARDYAAQQVLQGEINRLNADLDLLGRPVSAKPQSQMPPVSLQEVQAAPAPLFQGGEGLESRPAENQVSIELEILRRRLGDLHREEQRLEQEFYESFRRSHRVRQAPDGRRGPDSETANRLQIQARENQDHVFQVRAEIRQIQSRITQLETGSAR